MSIRDDYAKRYGLNSNWNPKDREEIRKYHKKLWGRWKKENGVGKLDSLVEKIPGFLDSLEQLHLYGYSLTDIGVMFGLTRERVRQYFEKHGL